jgi:hypothetical protein
MLSDPGHRGGLTRGRSLHHIMISLRRRRNVALAVSLIPTYNRICKLATTQYNSLGYRTLSEHIQEQHTWKLLGYYWT